jgi:hypothetical protein
MPDSGKNFGFVLYGTALHSDFHIAGAPEGRGEKTLPQIEIKVAPGGQEFAWTKSSAARDFDFQTSPNGHELLRWPDFIEFCIDPSRRIVHYRKLRDEADGLLENFFVHHVVSQILVKEGIESLHGTVLEKNGRGILLTGDAGYGKSTLAAALLANGFRLVTDDLVVIDQCQSSVSCRRGVSRLKLMADSYQFFEPRHDYAIECNGKRILHFSNEIAETSVALIDWYFLKPPERRAEVKEIQICDLRRSEIFTQLVANTYNLISVSRDRYVRHMHWCSRIANSIKASSLTIPTGLNFVKTTADLIAARTVQYG